ncbi:MAG: DUF2270 domain-containing protein [Haloarculaceae archaeon]
MDAPADEADDAPGTESVDAGRIDDGHGAPADVGRGLLEEEMAPSSAVAHLYRGEIHRMKLWRERLDRTTNWAVIVMAALLTWAFSSADNPHYIILIGVATLSVFMMMEARRYRGYDMWRSRVRRLQENVFAVGLDPTREPDPDWRARLGEDYRSPALKIDAEEAVAHRLRRVYLPLFAVLLAAWIVRVTAFSTRPPFETAAIGLVPGWLVIALVAAFYLGVIIVAVRPRAWHAQGELREKRLRKRG